MIAVIGGTGLAEALFGETAAREFNPETPFGKPSAPIRIVSWRGREVALLARHGAGHALNPTQVPYRANLYALKQLGVTRIIASGAVGSLREELRPRELVIVDQAIDRTTRRPATFFDDLAVHAEFHEPYCPSLRAALLRHAPACGTTVHPRGTYVCMEGPAFSTVAESRLHRAWGADLIGMTTMPEAKLAREAEICYAAVALVTDYDCWRPHEPGLSQQALLAEIIGNLKAAGGFAISLIRAVIESDTLSDTTDCACRRALELGLWTDRRHIAPAVLRRYGPLLSRHFPPSGG
ncbi:MAG: S-methyl-5'-thioadenosine phosphorylase [Phycisphaerales bacterium]|nr:S-methyl-5'-thioadenosine phosphorylase [Phycisphaerales bacterium]